MKPNVHLTALTAIILAATILVSCTGQGGSARFDTVYYAPEYAGGFEITGFKDSLSRVIRVKNAWQGADSVSMELFIARNGERPPEGFRGQVIREKAERIAAMSSSYIAMLDMLGKVETVKAVSGIRFITNEYVTTHSDSIADVGNEADADFEKLLSVSPDIVLLYGISASSAMENRLEALGIPYLYMGEYIEPSPLGKAEWIVALSELTGDFHKGLETFAGMASVYETLKASASIAADRPKVMLNVPYGDVWFMASCSSSIAAMLRDAGAEYIYKGNYSNRSLPIDIEEAFALASDADFWLDTGRITSIGELLSSYPEFSDVKSVRERKVYNCDRRLNRSGGNDFWESGQARPDIVLSDLIRIFHPELGGADSLYYYRRLE